MSAQGSDSLKKSNMLCGMLSTLLSLSMIGSAAAVGIPFTDVKENDWFYPAVEYAYEHRLMAGTGNNTFTPDETTTRGQVMTVLHHLAGSPETDGTCTFLDVPEDAFYRQAVAWAASQDIVAGYSADTFGPEDPVTREQLTSIFYRYAKTKHYNVSHRADLRKFKDRDQISPFAVETMSWANAIGLIAGTGPDTLAPGDGATRAQFASILMNFCDNPALTERPDQLGQDNRFVLRAARSADGRTIRLTLKLEGKVRVSGFDLRLNYDSRALSLRKLDTGYGLPIFSNSSVPGQIAFNYVGIDNLSEPRTILSAEFEIGENAVGSTAFGLEAVEVICVDPEQGGAILQAPFHLIPTEITL